MEKYIKKDEFKHMIKNYLLTDGKDIILDILKEIKYPKVENTSEIYHLEKVDINYPKKNNCFDKKAEEKAPIINTEEIITKKELMDFFQGIIAFDEEESKDMALTKIRELILKLFGNNRDLKQQNDELQFENNSYIKDIESLKEEKKRLNCDINEAERSIKSLNDRKNDFEKEVERLEKTIREKNEYNQKLETEVKEAINQLNELETIKNKLTGEIEDKKEKLKEVEQSKEKLNKRLNKLSDVEILQNLYDRYLSVSDNYREKLKNLIKSEDVSSFIACCYSIGTMDDLWDSLNIEVKNGNLSDAHILKEIFGHFVIQQNKKYDESIYKLLIPEIGEEFDATKHMSINGNTSGKIEKVIFPGYGQMESKTNPDQTDDERKFKKVKKLAMVETR